MRIMHREDQEQREHGMLSPDAAFSDESEGRDRSAEPDILRNDYQRDRDKILHTKSFRRLSHKTAGVPGGGRRPLPHTAHAPRSRSPR